MAVKTPERIGSVKAHWVAADLSLSDGANLVSWVDRVNGFALTPNIAAPTFVSSGLNGLPVVNFASASNQGLQAASAADWKLLHDGSGSTFIIVYKPATISTTVMHTLGSTAPSSFSDVGWNFRIDSRSSVSRDRDLTCIIAAGGVGGDHSPHGALMARPVVRLGSWQTAAVLSSQAKGVHQYIDGILAQTFDVDMAFNDIDNPDAPLTIGHASDGAHQFDGQIAEIIIFDEFLSEAQMVELNQYLFAKYQVGSVPVATGFSQHAFPGLTRISSTKSIASYYTDALTHDSDKGVIRAKITTDAGATWENEFLLASDVTYTVRGCGLRKLSTGRIIASLYRANYDTTPVSIADGVQTQYSDDEGETWSTPANVNYSTDREAMAGEVVELANGDLLLPAYGFLTGVSGGHAVVSKSTDQGDSWTHLAMIADGPSAGKSYTEPNILLLANGNLLCSIRNTTDDTIQFSTSTDSGATWSALTSGFSGSAAPAISQLSDGRVLCCYKENSRAFFRESSDNGATWGTSHPIQSPARNMVYGAWANEQNADGWLIHAQDNGTRSSEAHGTRVASVDYAVATGESLILISSPISTDELLVGTAHEIRWEGIRNGGTVDILLSTDNGSTYPITIASGETGSTYSWTPTTAQLATTAKIKVVDTADATVLGVSDAFTVSSPTSGHWQAVDGQTITVTQGDSYAGDDIEFTGSSADQWPDLTGATLEFRATMSGAPPVTATPVVTSATGTQTFTLPLSTTDTAKPVGRYRYDVQATWAETPLRVKTLVKNGPFVVERTHTDEP